MAKYQDILDMYLETEEIISAEEFLRRKEKGELNSSEVEIIPSDPKRPWGGFKVKLKNPRYKITPFNDPKNCYADF